MTTAATATEPYAIRIILQAQTDATLIAMRAATPRVAYDGMGNLRALSDAETVFLAALRVEIQARGL